MANLTDLSYIRELLSRRGMKLSHSLGQNFLINPSVAPRMAALSGAEGCHVVEIGPGIGVLTAELAKIARTVTAVELDPRLLPILDETLSSYDNVRVINADAMTLDFASAVTDHFSGEPAVVCANLPYYITSPMIMRLLEEQLPVTSVTVMVQKEAAARLCAPPGSRGCGAVSAAVSYYSCPQKLFDVSRGSFYPSPNVDSSVIRLDIYTAPPVELLNRNTFFEMVRAGFSQRRKTLRNALCSAAGIDKSSSPLLLERAGLSPDVRIEALNLSQLASLANEITRFRNG